MCLFNYVTTVLKTLFKLSFIQTLKSLPKAHVMNKYLCNVRFQDVQPKHEAILLVRCVQSSCKIRIFCDFAPKYATQLTFAHEHHDSSQRCTYICVQTYPWTRVHTKIAILCNFGSKFEGQLTFGLTLVLLHMRLPLNRAPDVQKNAKEDTKPMQSALYI